MEEEDSKGTTGGYANVYAERVIDALGRGFDLTSDFRLRYAKERLVVLGEGSQRDVFVPGGGVVRGVPPDIQCDKGDRIRFRSDVLQFNQVNFVDFAGHDYVAIRIEVSEVWLA